MKYNALLRQENQNSEQITSPVAETRTGVLIAERFQVVQQIRQDWDSESWVCVDRGTQELVIAVRHHEIAESSIQRLQNDVHRILSLNSHRLGKILATETSGDSTWVVLESLPGDRLANAFQNQTFSYEQILSIFKELLLAVADLHSIDVTHTALSPQNIFFTETEQSISCQLMWSGRRDLNKPIDYLTKHDVECLSNFSPESLGLTTEPIGPTSDIYSIACLIYNLIAGRSPFLAENLNDLLYLQTTKTPPTLRELGKSHSRFLDEILHRCLQFHCYDRYQSVAAILFDVESLINANQAGSQDPELTIGTKDVRSSLTTSAFCAREGEFAKFLEAFERTEKGCAQAVILAGESGVGKSRLLQEFRNAALGRRASIYCGVATTDLGSPFQILEDLCRQVAVRASKDPKLAEQILGQCNGYADVIVNALPVLEDLFQTQFDKAEPFSVGEASTLRAICCLLESLGRENLPAVVIFDDCQWDIEFITRLMKMWRLHQSENSSGTQYTMILCAFRSEEVPAEHSIWSLNHLRQILLRPISNPQIRLILKSMAGPLPEPALTVIQDLADGSPFMASAILHGLVESGGLIATESGWEIDKDKFNQVHSSAKAGEILAQRLNSLSKNTRQVLEVGALLGTTFELGILSSIVTLSQQEIERALEDARKRHLLWSRRGESSCQFLHDKIREELQSKLDGVKRQELHFQIANEIQKVYPTRIAELAYHFEQAENFDLAYQFSKQAADSALKKHALQVAKQQFEIAIRTAPHTTATNFFAVQEGFGEVLMLLGKYQNAEQVFEEAALSVKTDLERAGIKGRQGELCIKRGDMNSAILHFENALRVMSQVIPKSRVSLIGELTKESVRQILHSLFPKIFLGRKHRELSQQEKMTLRLLSGFSHASWYCRSKSLTLWAHLRGMNKGELFNPSIELAQAYSDHAPAMILIPYYARAYQYVVKSLKIRNELQHIWGQGQSLHFKGIVHYANCDYENCVDECRKAINILERTGDYWQVHIARYQLAAALFRLGKYNEACVECRRNYESGMALGDFQATGIILDIWVQASQDRIPEGVINFEISRLREDVQGESQVILATAISYLKCEKTEEAIQLLLQAKHKIEAAGVQNTYTTPIYTWLVAAYRQAATEDQSVSQMSRKSALRKARKAGRAALSITKRFSNELPKLYRELAFISAMEGKSKQANTYLQQSLSISSKHGAQIEHAFSLAARKKIGMEFGWSTDANERESFSIAQIRLDILKFHSQPTENRDSISLADRFETLMKAGRNIMSARDVSEITRQAIEASRRLLRVPHAKIEWITSVRPQDGLDDHKSRNQSIEGESDQLNVFVTVRSDIVAKLVIEQEGHSRSFNEIDRQIAEFISSLLGAALENAEGFMELQKLNENLEFRVAERTEELKDRNDQLSRSNRELETVAKALRRTQTRLVESIRAARTASESKGRFLAMMSHEIRTPMNGIIGMTQLALQSCHDAQQKSHLNTVTQSAKTLLTILNDVLDFSKIEAGKLNIDSIPFNLHDSVIDACRLLAIKAEEKKLKYRCRISPDVPRRVVGDPNRIRQVLLNLIGNAIKFTTAGSIDIVVECGRKNDSSTEFCFTVVDTGIGIAEEDLGKIFEAFDQGDASVTRRFGGTGLGLSISRELVNLMGGEMTIESQVGKGSTFSFGLDLVECLDAKPEKFAPCSLLLYSQDEIQEKYLEQCLSYLGHQVTRIDNVETLKSLIPDSQSSKFDMLIIDTEEIQLTEDELIGTAIDLIPLILLVPSVRESDPSMQLRMNLCANLMKPFTLQEFQDTIHNRHTKEGVLFEKREADQYEYKVVDRILDILVVDDSEINLMVAKAMIESAGHRIKTAQSGQEAIDELQRNSFDAIFMDIEMPQMDGLTATIIIREQEQLEQRTRTPIYAMTAHVLDEFKLKCKKVGMNGFISKPIDHDELINFLAEFSVTVNVK